MPLSTPDIGGPAQPLMGVRGLVKHFPLKKDVFGRGGGVVEITVAAEVPMGSCQQRWCQGKARGMVGAQCLRKNSCSSAEEHHGSGKKELCYFMGLHVQSMLCCMMGPMALAGSITAH